MAIALAMAQSGADIIVHARSEHADLLNLRDRLVSMGRKVHVLVADICDPVQRRRLVDEAWGWQSRVNIWINNAGADCLTGPNALLSFDEKMTLLWHTDVLGTVDLTRQIARRMAAHSEGCIINMGWDQAETGMEGESGELFAATKGAIAAYTRSAARSFAPKVRLNCVAPGWIRTGWGKTASLPWQRRAVQESLLGRWGTPEDVAQVCAFLASSAASFINGQVIAVNGGFAGRRFDEH